MSEISERYRKVAGQFTQRVGAALDDPDTARRQRDTPMGRASFEQTIDRICTGDVLVHTWDLARATGLDESLDPDEVHRFVEGMEPLDELLRQSGQYGARVPVPDDADEQTRLIAFVGRDPQRSLASRWQRS
ncbi:MAG: hypothetical protein H0U41_01300 [Actinobacteria bacterium]|nr:hypothetical protein [Actinomycetota bacterium]